MDGRVRRRKSLWEEEDVNLRNCWSGKEQYSSHNIGYSHKFSTFEADNNLSMPKDQAYAGKRMYRGVQDEPGIRERGLNKNFYKSMYAGFDGWDRRKRSRSRDDGLVHSSRYLERSGRSRSRGRDRGTSRSRSHSRGRDKDRMRIRSRSGSRRRNGARGRTRSRSPLYDHRRESDRGNATSKSGPSSHSCRDFTAGNCRTGSQCWFLHPDDMDGDRSDGFNERRRSGQERGRAMIYGEGPGIQSLDKVADSSYGEDDSFRNTDRGKICCRDFVRGNCKMGASCRFSHHSGSGDNIAKSTRNASLVRDSQQQSREKSKSLCKYFLAGKCNRGDCWFSHDDPADGKHERRSHYEGDHQGSAVKNKVWNGPAWYQTPESDIGKGTKQSEHAVADQKSERRPHDEGDCHGLAVTDKVWNGHNWDQTPELDIPKGTGWSEHIVANHNSERRSRDEGERHTLAVKNIEWNGPTWDQTTESDISKGTGWGEGVIANEKSDNAAPSERMDNKWALEGRSWGSPELKEKASEKNCFVSPHVWNDGNDRDSVTSKSVGGNVNDRNEYPPISQGLELASLDEVSTSSHAQNITQEASGNHLSLPIIRNDVSINSDTQQHAMVVKDNLVKPFSYDGLGEVNALGNTINSEFLSRKNTFSYERLSEVKELGSTVNPEFITRKSPNQNSVGIRNFNQSSVSSDQRDNLFFQHPSNLQNFDLNGPSQVLSSSFNMQNQNEIFQKEAVKTPEMQEFGARQSFFSNAPTGQVAQFFPTPTVAFPVQKFEQAPAHVHTALNLLKPSRLASTLQNSMRIQLNPLGDGRWQRKDQTSGYSLERVNQIPVEQFSPMSGNGIELEEALPNDSSMAHFLESPKSKQQGTPAVSELKKPEKTAVSELKEQETPAITEQKEQEASAVLEVKHSTNSVVEFKEGKENISKENGDGHGKVENGRGNKDDKDIRLFKNALVESVKEILKPTWRLGRMSREVHKTIVKKVIDKVTSTHQADHIPRTQDKIDQYLSHSKPKISKLVQAYVDRHLKAESS